MDKSQDGMAMFNVQLKIIRAMIDKFESKSDKPISPEQHDGLVNFYWDQICALDTWPKLQTYVRENELNLEITSCG